METETFNTLHNFADGLSRKSYEYHHLLRQSVLHSTPASDVDRVNDCTRCHLSIVSGWRKRRGKERKGKERRGRRSPQVI